MENVQPFWVWFVVVLVVLWSARWCWRKWRKTHQGGFGGPLGDAHFATPQEVVSAGLLGQKGIRLGYYQTPQDRKRRRWGQVIRYSGDAHVVTVAPTRTGKGRDVLTGVLLEYPGSVVCIDPKGELAAVTKAERERMGQTVIVLNPFELFPEILGPTARYNPMALLDSSARTFGTDCERLADAVGARDEKDTHWTDMGRDLIAGVIMQLAAHGRPEKKNLAAVREIIAGPEERLVEFARQALTSDNVFIKQKLAAFANEDAKNRGELSSIISTARRLTAFIGNKVISESLSGLDFRFGDLKRAAQTVYVILPGDELTTCGTWFRLIVGCALNELWRGAKGALQVLAIVDEFAQVGRLAILESAMGMAAGFGVQIWPVLQDLTQLRKHYGDGWETFLSGAEVQQFFGPRDQFTADYVSKHAGVTTVMTTSTSSGSSSHSASFNQAQQPLIHPHKVMGLGHDEAIIFGPRNIVINARRRPYYHIAEFRGLYDRDPYHPVTEKTSAEVIQLMEKDGHIYFDSNVELATIDARPHEWSVCLGWKDHAKDRFVSLTHKPTGLKFLVIPAREWSDKDVEDLKASDPRTDWFVTLLEESRLHRLSRKFRGGRQSKATRQLGQAALAWTLRSLGVLPNSEAQRPPKNFIEALNYPTAEKIVLDANGPKDIQGKTEDWTIYYADNDIEEKTPFVHHMPSDLHFAIMCPPSRQRFKLDPFNDCCALLFERNKVVRPDAATVELGRSALILYLVHVGAWGLVHEATKPRIYLDPNDQGTNLTIGQWEDWKVQYIDEDIKKRAPVVSHEPTGLIFAVALLPGRKPEKLDPFKDCYACLVESSKEQKPDDNLVKTVGRNAIFVCLVVMNAWGFAHEFTDPTKIYLNPDPEAPTPFIRSEWTMIQGERADAHLMRHDPTGCVFLINRAPSKSIESLDPFKDCVARLIEAPKPMPDEEKTELGRAAILAYINHAQKGGFSREKQSGTQLATGSL